ncbi:MAG: hypothetical protein HQ562_05740 [Candidatus Marinimicrobia bacterium]|nr:hypothetical protein [Candidatus Neomarinimicrobiota bacterium]
MTEPIETNQQTDVLELSLTLENQLMLEKLATWGRIVAIVNIIFGIINCLTIFALAIPIVVVGIFMILMGTKLNSAVAHLRYGLYHKDSVSFTMGLDHIRSYLLYNGIMMLMMVTLLIVIIIIALTAGAAFYEIFEEYMGTI